MRSQTEMINLIVNRARQDAHVRAVLLRGSRVNPEVKPDCFQDYDVVYVAENLTPFLSDPKWTDCFGEIMIRRLPNRDREGNPKQEGELAYRMQFMDGTRMKLTLLCFPLIQAHLDGLTRVLLDKDGMIPALPEPNDRTHAVRPPDAAAFSHCCNEFWWTSTCVAKGLWRWEIPSAKAMMDGPMREMLLEVLTWFVGIQTGFEKNIGENGKFLQKYLSKPMWLSLLKTYADAEREHIWEALFVLCDLFDSVGSEVARALGFAYPEQEISKVSEYLRQVRSLPGDAQEIYPEKKEEPPYPPQAHRVSSDILLQFLAE